MKSLNQLLLDFDYEQNFKDDDFYVGDCNFYPFELINKWPKWEKNFLNLIGERFSGKTHLTNIFLKKFNGIRVESSLLNNENLKKIKPYQNIVLEDLNTVLENLKNIYEDEWKKNNEINTSIKLPLTIYIKSKEYKKILYMEELLANNDLISNFYILKFDNEFTQYRIIYNGSPKTFFNNMDNKYFNLAMENNVWTVK